MPDYTRPAMTPRTVTQKPLRGQRVLEREEERASLLASERREKAAAKKRDGGCRWPETHTCRGGLESAHVRDASLGGLCFRWNLITLCAWLHRRGPQSIHGKQLRVEIERPELGTDGPCSFWKVGEDGQWYMVRRETGIRQYERD